MWGERVEAVLRNSFGGVPGLAPEPPGPATRQPKYVRNRKKPLIAEQRIKQKEGSHELRQPPGNSSSVLLPELRQGVVRGMHSPGERLSSTANSASPPRSAFPGLSRELRSRLASHSLQPGPNPALATMLGFIPGVGAMYNGQFVKAMIHVLVFVILIAITDQHDFFGILHRRLGSSIRFSTRTRPPRRGATDCPCRIPSASMNWPRIGWGTNIRRHPISLPGARPPGQAVLRAGRLLPTSPPPPYTPPAASFVGGELSADIRRRAPPMRRHRRMRKLSTAARLSLCGGALSASAALCRGGGANAANLRERSR